MSNVQKIFQRTLIHAQKKELRARYMRLEQEKTLIENEQNVILKKWKDLSDKAQELSESIDEDET